MSEVPLTITSSSVLDPDAVEVVHAGLRSYNDAYAGPGGRAKVQLFIRDGDGSVRGGLIGTHLWGWLYLETLWVEEVLRGVGWGSRLLSQAEAEARSAGCTRALLDTFEFQALSFYEHRGYSIFATLDDFPPGYRRYYLKKDLTG
jgi:GNAT superfamily N-acetyltransferase